MNKDEYQEIYNYLKALHIPKDSVGIGLGLGLGRDLDGTGRDLDNKILMSGTCPKIIYKNKFQILYRLILF